MKRIVCELCEGTQFTKEGGFFVCHGCGTKYSLAEAKSMMQEVEGEPEPFVGGSPVVAAPVGNPNQQQIDNILILATTAYEAQNYQEAENYCNRAIELDATAYRAWILKGKAVGWSSKMDNMRVEEAAHSFCKAIDFAPMEEQEQVKNDAVEELKRLGLAIIATRKTRFAGSPSKEELEGFGNDRKVLLNALLVLLTHGNAVEMPEGYLEEIATMMNDSAMEAFDKAVNAWKQIQYPTEQDLVTYLEWNTNIIVLLQQAIDASDKDDEADIGRLRNLIRVLEDPMDKSSYKNQWVPSLGMNLNLPDKSLNDAAKAERRAQIKECNEKIVRLEKEVAEKKAEDARRAEEERKARLAAYWEAHKEEKAALDAEKEELTEQKIQIQTELNEVQKELDIIAKERDSQVPSEVEFEKVRSRIKELDSRIMNLGMFSGREKKQLNDERSALYGRRDSLKEKIPEEKKVRDAEVREKQGPLNEKKREINERLDAVVKRMATIEVALTKDPEE